MKILTSSALIFSQLIFTHLTILCLSSDAFVGAVDPYFQACSVPRRCGNQTISFPFYLRGIQEDYCGYPGFNISCVYDRPILKLSGDDYIVRNIFYQNQSLIVSNAAFSHPNRNETCLHTPVQSFSVPSDYTLASDKSKVFLFQTCRSSSLVGTDLAKYKIGNTCYAESNATLVLALPENDKNKVAEASEKCGNGSSAVELPVMEYNNSSENEEIREVLNRGFMLNWIASDCSRCNTSGGMCGFNISTHLFKCYCSDRPHSGGCDSPPG